MSHVTDFEKTLAMLNQKDIPAIPGPVERYVFIKDPDGLVVGIKAE